MGVHSGERGGSGDTLPSDGGLVFACECRAARRRRPRDALPPRPTVRLLLAGLAWTIQCMDLPYHFQPHLHGASDHAFWMELLRGPGCVCGVERWGSECLYTSYVTIPGLRYRGTGRRRPSGTSGRSRRSWSQSSDVTSKGKGLIALGLTRVTGVID